MAIIVVCVLFSFWSLVALALFVIGMGTYEMGRLQHIDDKWLLVLMEFGVVGFYLSSLFLPGLKPLFLMCPFLLALFSKRHDFKTIATLAFGAFAFVAYPCTMMTLMHHSLGSEMVLLVFVLLWVNDTFAYLTGRLLGKHKLFERISPGKTIEGSIGGLVFTLAGVMVFSHYVDWLSMKQAVGMGLIAVVFGTLGDLCESMLKRQAGVKDSGNLIPGHGGILDRFDSVLFAFPFIYSYLLLV